jgi:hypothetical protein
MSEEEKPEAAPIENEAMQEARRVKAQNAAKAKRAAGWKTAAGIGIGSAAIAAALIFANRNKKDG